MEFLHSSANSPINHMQLKRWPLHNSMDLVSAVVKDSKCTIRGIGTLCDLGATVTGDQGPVKRSGSPNVITAFRKCKIKKEDDYFNCGFVVLYCRNKQIYFLTHL